MYSFDQVCSLNAMLTAMPQLTCATHAHGLEAAPCICVTHSIHIFVYTTTLQQGGWRPFAADDVQLEFIMLDPYERITLSNDAATAPGVFTTTFMAPDTYGIFKLRVMYRRVGLTVLLASTQVCNARICNCNCNCCAVYLSSR
jgi:Oligosaccharyltransferase 48 kDa subunit beta